MGSHCFDTKHRKRSCSRRLLPCLFIVAMVCGFALNGDAWEHHPLITEPVLETFAESGLLRPTAVVTLQDFLVAVEGPLAGFLLDEEDWARAHLPWYAPLPEDLVFVATGTREDIVARFFRAIRINPNTKTPLYYAALSGQAPAGASLLANEQVSLFPDSTALDSFDFVAVLPGGALNALDIIATATNEPDYGMDTGLFEDNNTPFGAAYGFGNQPFGNPGLDYGSQAPFHIGFYHESPLVFFFARFLERTYPEYRIRLFKRLSEFAFQHDQDYWGWRFMGWGLHYLADLSMPYHTTVLPGYSTLRMLWINFLDILGFSRPVDNAVQLVSNRHLAIERYQRIVMERALRTKGDHIIFERLSAEYETPTYRDELPREVLARASNSMARRLDRAIEKYMPADFVDNPGIELADVEAVEDIVDMVEDTHGAEAVAELDALLADALELFAIYGRSFIIGILDAHNDLQITHRAP